MLTLMPRITVLTALRVFGEPCAHIRRSVAVCIGYQHSYTCENKNISKSEETYRHDLPPLANNALLGTNINNSTIKRPSSLLNHPNDQENPRLSSDGLKLLPGAIAARGLPAITTNVDSLKPTIHPVVPRARTLAHGVAEVDSLLKVPHVLVPALGAPAADHAAEVRAARVPAQVRLRQEEDVRGVVTGGAPGDLAQLRKGGGRGGLG